MFNEAVSEVLKQSKYDILTGRYINYKAVAAELFFKALNAFLSLFKIKTPSTLNYNKEAIFNFFLLILGVLIAAIIIVLVINLRKRQKQHMEVNEIFKELSQQNITDEQMLEMSRQATEKGLHREAIRYQYTALLWVLNAKNIIYINPYKTNSQIKREVKANANFLLNDFSEAVNMFNLVWFGHKNIVADKFDEYYKRTESLIIKVKYL